MLRQLGPDDAAAFRAIRLEGLLLDPRAFTADHAEEAARPLADTAARLAEGFVLGADGGAGLAAIAGLAVPTNPKLAHKGLIWGVYVQPAARGRGLATQLLAALIDAARGRVEAVHLAVGGYNHAAIGCYRRLGFVACGHEERALRVGDDYIDEITMALRFD